MIHVNRCVFGVSLAMILAAPAPARFEPRLSRPPADWGLSPFYTKHVSLNGFPVLGSAKVSDYALFEAAYIVDRMLADRPKILEALTAARVRLAVMAFDERTIDIPEHSDLTPATYWNRRARGLGATRQRPAVSCAEENLLGFPGDPYSTENILVHEFAHAIHEMGMSRLDRTFDDRLRLAFEAAKAEGLWQGTYAMTNRSEYFAEGVQSWFDTNRPPDDQHNEIDTREELQKYDPRLSALILEVFGENAWRYVKPENRPEAAKGHLTGFDRAMAPRFSWKEEPRGDEVWERSSGINAPIGSSFGSVPEPPYPRWVGEGRDAGSRQEMGPRIACPVDMDSLGVEIPSQACWRRL